MSRSLSLIHDYYIEDTRFFNDYDTNSFVSTANVALGKKIIDFSIFTNNMNYGKMLDRSLKYVNDITIDSFVISEFISKVLYTSKIEKSGIFIRDISGTATVIIKPQYLTEAVNFFKTNVAAVIDGKMTIDEIKKINANCDNYIDTLKKRIGTTDIPYSDKPKDFIKKDVSTLVPISTAYLSNVVIPFIKKIPDTKKEIIISGETTKKAINTTLSDLKSITDTLNTLNIETVTKNTLYYYTYNFVRGIMSVVSYITYINLRKINIFENRIIDIQNMYNEITLLFNESINVVESGAYNSRLITAVDENNLVESLLDGKIDAYSELANNIIEYHKGYLSTRINCDNDSTEFITHSLEEYGDYDKNIYDRVSKMYIEIGEGINILAANSDDYLLVFDDLINKSGFVIPLQDRFSDVLNSILNMEDLSITDLNIESNIKSDVYLKILTEINDYPKNIQTIADISKKMWQKLEYVENIFKSEKNGELGSSETMNELKIFIETLREQYKLINRTMTKNFYTRLKLLAEKADSCLNDVSNEDKVKLSDVIDIDNRDFLGEAVVAAAEFRDEFTDFYMEMFMREYRIEREYIETGIRYVYEDGTTNDVKPNTKVVVKDNSSGTSKVLDQGRLNKILSTISEWFTKMIDAFTSMINKFKQKNMKWVQKHKSEILNRRYTNVQIDILPYDKAPSPEKIEQDITSFTTNLSAMNRSNIEKVDSYESLRSKLITFGINFNKDGDEKTAITNYYKVGNNKLEVAHYSNNEIKTYVQNYMIPYCEAFYESYYNSLKSKLDDVKNKMEEVIKTYLHESVIGLSNLSIFTEADENGGEGTSETQTTPSQSAVNNANVDTTTNTNASNTASNISQKSDWVQSCTRNYIGSVLTALRDRNNDYLKTLFALAPKKSDSSNNKTNTTEEPVTNANESNDKK